MFMELEKPEEAEATRRVNEFSIYGVERNLEDFRINYGTLSTMIPKSAEGHFTKTHVKETLFQILKVQETDLPNHMKFLMENIVKHTLSTLNSGSFELHKEREIFLTRSIQEFSIQKRNELQNKMLQAELNNLSTQDCFTIVQKFLGNEAPEWMRKDPKILKKLLFQMGEDDSYTITKIMEASKKISLDKEHMNEALNDLSRQDLIEVKKALGMSSSGTHGKPALKKQILNKLKKNNASIQEVKDLIKTISKTTSNDNALQCYVTSLQRDEIMEVTKHFGVSTIWLTDPNDIPKEIIHHAKQNELKVSDLENTIANYNSELTKIHECLTQLDKSHLKELKKNLSISSKKNYTKSELENQLMSCVKNLSPENRHHFLTNLQEQIMAFQNVEKFLHNLKKEELLTLKNACSLSTLGNHSAEVLRNQVKHFVRNKNLSLQDLKDLFNKETPVQPEQAKAHGSRKQSSDGPSKKIKVNVDIETEDFDRQLNLEETLPKQNFNQESDESHDKLFTDLKALDPEQLRKIIEKLDIEVSDRAWDRPNDLVKKIVQTVEGDPIKAAEIQRFCVMYDAMNSEMKSLDNFGHSELYEISNCLEMCLNVKVNKKQMITQIKKFMISKDLTMKEVVKKFSEKNDKLTRSSEFLSGLNRQDLLLIGDSMEMPIRGNRTAAEIRSNILKFSQKSEIDLEALKETFDQIRNEDTESDDDNNHDEIEDTSSEKRKFAKISWGKLKILGPNCPKPKENDFEMLKATRNYLLNLISHRCTFEFYHFTTYQKRFPPNPKEIRKFFESQTECIKKFLQENEMHYIREDKMEEDFDLSKPKEFCDLGTLIGSILLQKLEDVEYNSLIQIIKEIKPQPKLNVIPENFDFFNFCYGSCLASDTQFILWDAIMIYIKRLNGYLQES